MPLDFERQPMKRPGSGGPRYLTESLNPYPNIAFYHGLNQSIWNRKVVSKLEWRLSTEATRYFGRTCAAEFYELNTEEGVSKRVHRQSIFKGLLLYFSTIKQSFWGVWRFKANVTFFPDKFHSADDCLPAYGVCFNQFQHQ